MHELRARVPESTIKTLQRRTSRLVELVDRATTASPIKEIREGGAQLIDLLNERMEEVRELHGMDDEDLPDRIRAFAMRLDLAEQKVMTWPQAKVVRKSKSDVQGRRARPHRSVKSAA